MNLRDLQKAELDVLKSVLSIIKENNLSYFMLDGTLLGAVRHKGFIPWDDDIDIGMPRDDYDLLMEKAQNTLPDFLQIRSFKDNPLYNQYIIKVENTNIMLHRNDSIEKKESYVWIDIFPLDGMPSGRIKQRIHQFRLLFRRLLLQYSKFKQGVNIKRNRPLFEKILIAFGYIVTRIFVIDTKKQLFAIDRLLRKYPYNTSEYIVNFMGAYKFKEMFPKYYYGKGLLYQFEDIELCGPIEYDKILLQMYGKYMEFPPENERIGHSFSLDT